MATSISNASHQIKKLNFNGSRHIVTETEGSSHALLALTNALILRSSMQLPSTLTTVSKNELVEHIFNFVLSPPAPHNEFQLNSALEFLTHRPWEMAVDPKFTGVTHFSSTPGHLFSMLGVRLFHTCLVDPNVNYLASMMEGLSCKELDNKIALYKASGDQSKIDQANAAIDLFMTSKQTYGLVKLAEKMNEGELGVLFQDEKFVTVYKRENVVYQLVSDEEYLSREDVVWETLEDGKLVDKNFEDINDSTNPTLVVKVCPQGHYLKLKPTGRKFKCNSCGSENSSSDLCYECDDREGLCEYAECGVCYFKGQKGNGRMGTVEKLQLLDKCCPMGHNLVWSEEGTQKLTGWRCDCCNGEFKAGDIYFQCSYPKECKYIVCGNCFYDIHSDPCGVRKQVPYELAVKDDGLSIIVMQVVSPGKFWFQFRGKQTSEALDDLMQDMAEFYRRNEGLFGLSGAREHLCKPGAIMAAPFEEVYHRVRITKICKESNIATVFYVDYGTRSDVPISEIKILPNRFRSLPSQAIEAKLWGVSSPGSEKTWPYKSTARFHELVNSYSGGYCYSIVKLVQKDSDNQIFHMKVFDAAMRKGSMINQILVDEGLAVDECISEVWETVEDEPKNPANIHGETVDCGTSVDSAQMMVSTVGNNNDEFEDCQDGKRKLNGDRNKLQVKK